MYEFVNLCHFKTTFCESYTRDFTENALCAGPHRTKHDAEGQPLVEPRDDRRGRAGGREGPQREERDGERREERRLQQLVFPAETVPGSKSFRNKSVPYTAVLIVRGGGCHCCVMQTGSWAKANSNITAKVGGVERALSCYARWRATASGSGMAKPRQFAVRTQSVFGIGLAVDFSSR